MYKANGTMPNINGSEIPRVSLAALTRAVNVGPQNKRAISTPHDIVHTSTDDYDKVPSALT